LAAGARVHLPDAASLAMELQRPDARVFGEGAMFPDASLRTDELQGLRADTGIAIYTGVNDFYQPLREILHPLYAFLRLFTPLYNVVIW
jgi:hypothetical protein